MQVQNISVSQNVNPNFKGKINVLPGNLSYNPARTVRKAYDAMQALIQDKPIDLLIKQNYKTKNVVVLAKKPEDFGKKNAPKFEVLIPDAADMDDDYRICGYSPVDVYIQAARLAAREYEYRFLEHAVSQPKKGFFAAIGKKLKESLSGSKNS